MFHGAEVSPVTTNTNVINRRTMFRGQVLHANTPDEQVEAAREVLAMSPAFAAFSEDELMKAARFNYRAILDARRRQLRERPASVHDVHAAACREVHVLSILYSRGYVPHLLLKEALDLKEASGHMADAYAEYAAGRDDWELAGTKVANMLGYLVAKTTGR